jgi:hypothetical protein
MKRVILLAVILLLSVVFAAAAEPDYKALVDDINIFNGMYQAPKFDASTATISQTDSYKWTASMKSDDPNIDLMLSSADGDNISSVLCICNDESSMTDYLACCCAIASEYRETLGIIEPYGYILYNYMMCRAGQESTPLNANDGTLCALRHDNGRYIMMIVFPS